VVTVRDVEQIPPGNLRVPRDEFAAVWIEAERLDRTNARNGTGDWYVVGVLSTCRWIAGGSVVFNYPQGPKTQPASAPVTKRTARAHEELIEAELLAAERLAGSESGRVASQPGWIEAVIATFNWTWRGSGRPPLHLGSANTG
jgi:hypothetical protein